ncbi:hypothetical protein [Lactococcus lactis]|uniref:hypothetical protein n=1 Tax=Lactococcus lactis TaxID=1358 RepID=UPI002890E9C4|nr:hypothetical protein [Lactococcus lactis]MDT2876491.1 hypothetical protein [Lactococcus lactis]MDT2887433.1 hypothetical protein [Lactococcus lactis]MDT2929991.1 hypothetical protein [Lactococcus lactis]
MTTWTNEMKKSGLVVKSYTLYDLNKNILLYHSFKFNEQQNKAVNREIMKYRKKYNLKVD